MFCSRTEGKGDPRATGIHPDTEKDVGLAQKQPTTTLLPKSRNGIVLVTSRHMDIALEFSGSHEAVFTVSPMEEAEALDLFRKKLRHGQEGRNDEHAYDAIRALDCIPLAIVQGATYIRQHAPQISTKSYIDIFQERQGNLAILERGPVSDALRPGEAILRSVAATWEITVEHLRQERLSAVHLLSLISFFAPHGIPTSALNRYSKNFFENSQEDLNVLRKYALVARTTRDDSYSVHSLVQLCTRLWMSLYDDERQWKQIFLRALSQEVSPPVRLKLGLPAGHLFLMWNQS